MSQSETDTASIAPDGDAENSSESTESTEGVVVVTEGELNELGLLLQTIRNILLGHETRLLSAEGRLAALEGNFDIAEKPGLVVVGNFKDTNTPAPSKADTTVSETDPAVEGETPQA